MDLFFAGQRVLITGATGELGGALVHRLCRAGATVLATGRNKERLHSLQARYPGLQAVEADLRLPLSYPVKADYVLHCAGPVGPKVFEKHPEEVLSTNVISTLNLLERVAGTACKGFVFASSHEVYGETPGKQFVEETDQGLLDPLNPRTCYGMGKRAAENALACYHKTHGLRTISARLSRFYGPGMNMGSGLFICDFLKNATAGEPVVVKGNAGLLRPLTHVQDVASAMLQLLKKGKGGEAYNVQADQPLTLGQTAELVAKAWGVNVVYCQPETLKEAPYGQILNSDKLVRLGWKALKVLNKGSLEETQ